MPKTSNIRFDRSILGPAAEAFAALGPYSKRITAICKGEARRIGIEPEDFLGQTPIDFSALSLKLQKMSLPVFRRQIREICGTLLKCGVTIPMSHQVALYRLLQGALSNVLKHPSAKNVTVSLGCMKNSVLILVIQEDGLASDTTGKAGNRSFGLTAMRERVAVLGGRMHIQSMPAGSMSKFRGTRIEVDLPLSGGMQ